ncbi:MAG: FKBP-type peptidyl-prolyl cis-trans isomerase [Candidatus Zixiibacteriota bacterium]
MRQVFPYLQSVLVLLVVGCSGEKSNISDREESAQLEAASGTAELSVTATITKTDGDTVTTESGLKYVDIIVGEGPSPIPGQMCETHYSGWLSTGKKFDSSYDRGQTFKFPIGVGRVLRGWDEGVAAMNVGGRRMLIVPHGLAYGEDGRAPQIPPKSTLIFDIKLIAIGEVEPGDREQSDLAESDSRIHKELTTIRGTDTGYEWRRAVESAKVSLCKDIAKRLNKNNWGFYYDVLDSFYDSNEPDILGKQISLVIGLATAISDGQQ